MGNAKSLDGKAVLETVNAFFADKSVFRLVIVYGSAVRGTLGKHSDVDVALAGDGALDRDALHATAASLSAALGREVDVVDLYRAEGLILYRIIVEGRRIKTDAGLYVKYQSKALGFREDFKPLQDMVRNARIRRFINGS